MNNQRTNILACIDGSALHDAVVDYAAWVAKTLGSPLKLMHNIEQRHLPQLDLSGSIGLGSRESMLEELTELEAKSSKILKQQGKLLLEHGRARAVAAGVADVDTLQRHGSFADSLIDMEEDMRVLVLGVRGEDHQHSHTRIGSQLETVIRNMHRPVLAVNRPFAQPPQRIMLAYDGSEAAGKALDMVGASALYKGMHCHLVQVAGDTAPTGLEDAASRLKAAGLHVEVATLQGSVEPALLDYQRQHNIDLTVMGAFGHSRLRELLFGSTTVKMLCNAQAPLLLLR